MHGRQPFGPMEHLDAARLREEQLATLASPRRNPSPAAGLLFLIMDVLYGKERTL